MRSALIITAFCAGFCAACGGDTGADAGGAAPTSAVEPVVVEHPASAWDDAPVWRMEPEPVLSIGVVDGPPEYELANVTTALRLDDGTIVLTDAGSGELRFFDSRGSHVRSVGRRGEGPGEYRYASMLARNGADSLLVWDGYLARGTMLGRDGGYGRNLSRPHLAGDLHVIDAFGDGSLLASLTQGYGAEELAAIGTGAVRHDALYLRFVPAGPVDTIARLFGEEQYTAAGMLFYNVPFARRGLAAAAGDVVHYGSSDRYEINTYDLDGELVRTLRGERAVPIGRRDIQRAIEASGHQERSRRAFSEMEFPETMPAYSALEVDAEANLWVADYRPPGGEDEALEWTIFAADGTLRGRLTMPGDFTLFEIGDDYLLGKSPDELGVERVRLHRLVKSNAR